MDVLPKSQFWMVYGVGQREPTYQHASIDDATREAKRLARLHPDVPFIVLEAVRAVVKRDVDLITLRHPNGDDSRDEIPF